MERAELRAVLWRLLGIPEERGELAPEPRGELTRGPVTIERWIWTSEPGSRVPSALYRPTEQAGRRPSVVITCGHGGSKSQPQYGYLGQAYARLGVNCLLLDPIGEEERHLAGGLGTRAHDPADVAIRAEAAGRSIMGKLVFDTMRGLDFLLTRDDVDPELLGVAGNSLGGAKATWMLALETRLKMAMVCGWGFHDHLVRTSKFCTRLPNRKLRACCTWAQFLTLAAPHCAVLALNGDADTIIDPGDGRVWAGTRRAVDEAAAAWEPHGERPRRIDTWFEPGGGHRPYLLHPAGIAWLHRHLGTPGWTPAQLQALPTVKFGPWCDRFGIVLEPLYATELHQRGATLIDLGLEPMKREELACLRPDEVGDPRYTLEGWLDLVEGRR